MGGGYLHFPRIVRGHADNTPKLALPIHAGIMPGIACFPTITTRHRIIPRGRGVLHRASHDARASSPEPARHNVSIFVRRTTSRKTNQQELAGIFVQRNRVNTLGAWHDTISNPPVLDKAKAFL